MPHSYRTLLISLLLTGLVAASIWFYTRPEPVSVVVAPVERGLVEQTLANTRAGTIKACRRARLSPSIGGQIARLDVHEGDHVKTGQLLLELWNKDLLAEVELAISEATAARAKAKAACLNADVAQREAERLVKLQKKGASSFEEMDKAVTLAKAGRADCEAAHATAQVSAARIAVARAKVERTRLLTPFDGVIAEINGELNEYVTPSPIGIPTPPAIDLVDNTCFYVSAPIDEVDAPVIRVGMAARISLDAFADQTFEGRVRRVADYVLDIEKQARTVDVEVAFAKSEDLQQLLAGYSADIEVIVSAHQDVLRIPSQALVEENQVYLFLPETDTLQAHTINKGLANWDYTEVLEGLESGDLLVTSVDRKGVEDGAYARQEQ